MKLLFIIIFIISNYYIDNVNSYGESIGDYPNSFERESHNLLNLVRMFPTSYKNDFMKGFSNLNNVLVTSVYPPAKPLWYNYTINQASRFHSNDMSSNNCFQHESCDGTGPFVRLKSFINCPSGGTQGENIAAGTSTALATNNLLLCDSTTGNSVCTGDGVSDGHRKNMLSRNYANVGVGFSAGTTKSSFKSYWTQDFASGSCSLPTTPIISAYHTINYPETSPQFIAIYYNATMPSVSMSLVFVDQDSETTLPMSIKYGNLTFAAYSVSSNFTFCRQYYFLADTKDETYRYPDTGFLQLSTNSSCDSWVTGDAFSTSKSISFTILIALSLISVLLF